MLGKVVLTLVAEVRASFHDIVSSVMLSTLSIVASSDVIRCAQRLPRLR